MSDKNLIALGMTLGLLVSVIIIASIMSYKQLFGELTTVENELARLIIIVILLAGFISASFIRNN